MQFVDWAYDIEEGAELPPMLQSKHEATHHPSIDQTEGPLTSSSVLPAVLLVPTAHHGAVQHLRKLAKEFQVGGECKNTT